MNRRYHLNSSRKCPKCDRSPETLPIEVFRVGGWANKMCSQKTQSAFRDFNFGDAFCIGSGVRGIFSVVEIFRTGRYAQMLDFLSVAP